MSTSTQLEPPGLRPGAAQSRVLTRVVAPDPLSEAGVASQLRFRPEIDLLPPAGRADCRPEVVLVVCDRVDEAALAAVRGARPSRVVLVAGALDGPSVLAAVEAGLCGVVPRSAATGDRLAAAVLAAHAGEATLAPDLLGRLLESVAGPCTPAAPRALTYGGLTRRELDVLRLLAEGLSTLEIARRLAWSERTIKGVVHDLTVRLQLRNRVHAVAYALRAGLI